MYDNEREVGKTITNFLSGSSNTKNLKREDVFFTSKFASSSNYETARKSIRQPVKTCGLGYIDLFLLHSPYGGITKRLESWKAVEDAIEDGEVKIGGVSNFGVKHLEELLASKPRISPAVNQIEVHPFNTETNITFFCPKHGIIVEAYAPLARALRMHLPVIESLSKKYHCSWAQLMIRWSLQHGFIPLPKSVIRERIQANWDVSGFEIEKEDMKMLDSVDEYLVTDWDPVDTDQ
jgi:diketogulonate reductase-like aldo/keto reductase